MSHLPNTGLLSLLDDELRNILFPYGSFVDTVPDQVIISQGGQPLFYLVISGNFQVTINTDKGVITLENVVAGDCFGEMCLFNNTGASANVTGLDRGRLWYTDPARFQQFLYDSDLAGCALLVGINTILSRRLRSANQLVRKNQIHPTFVSVRHNRSLRSLNTPYDPNLHQPSHPYRLKGTGVLAYLTNESLRILASYGEFLEYPLDQIVVQESAYVDRFYVVLEGRLEVYIDVAGSPAHLSFAEPGECLGEVSLLDPGAASASVQVEEPAVLWSMGRDALRKLICDDPGLCGALLYGVAHGLEQRLRHLDSLIAHNHDDEQPRVALRTPVPITSNDPAQMTGNMFSVVKKAKQAGTVAMTPTQPEPPLASDPLALFKVQDLVQLFCLNGRKVKLLVLEPTGETGVIILWNGKVLHAEYAGKMGEEAFYAMVLLASPRLQLLEISQEPSPNVTTAWESLLMEAAVRVDMQRAGRTQ